MVVAGQVPVIQHGRGRVGLLQAIRVARGQGPRPGDFHGSQLGVQGQVRDRDHDQGRGLIQGLAVRLDAVLRLPAVLVGAAAQVVLVHIADAADAAGVAAEVVLAEAVSLGRGTDTVVVCLVLSRLVACSIDLRGIRLVDHPARTSVPDVLEHDVRHRRAEAGGTRARATAVVPVRCAGLGHTVDEYVA